MTQWSRQNCLQLNASAANDDVRFINRSREPAGVVSVLDPLFKPGLRFPAQHFKTVARNFAHVLEHPRALPRDDFGVLNRGATNSETIGHQSKLLTSDADCRMQNLTAQTSEPIFSGKEFV
jgi:hypothetical protein